jgi:hypothetical protein
VTSARELSPELGDLLDDIDHESRRCLDYSATLSRWSMFWHITLIFVGALVAAQGGALKVWGSSAWLTASFIVLGVVTAVGSGFQSLFKPGERSPKFAKFGLDYEMLGRQTKHDADEALRASEPDSPALPGIWAEIASVRYLQFMELRTSELSLYVVGPGKLGRRRLGTPST